MFSYANSIFVLHDPSAAMHADFAWIESPWTIEVRLARASRGVRLLPGEAPSGGSFGPGWRDLHSHTH